MSSDTDYHQRRGSLSAYGRAYRSSRTLLRLSILSVVLVVGAVAIASWIFFESRAGQVTPPAAAGLLLIVLAVLGITVLVLCRHTHRHFVEPDLAFRKWLQTVCDGDLEVAIDLPEQHPHYKELNFHTRNLASALSRLSDDMEELVEVQTRRLETQNRKLDLLFRLASDVSRYTDRRSVLRSVCRDLASWYENATVRGYLVEDRVHCVTQVRAVGAELDDTDTLYPAATVLGPEALVQRISYQKIDCGSYTERVLLPVFEVDELAAIIALDHEPMEAARASEAEQILVAVSEQLSLFMSKRLAELNARNTRLQHERTQFAGELHDSLAQTLLAIKYNLSGFKQQLHGVVGGSKSLEAGADHNNGLVDELQQIMATVDEANHEVRELIGAFRKPASEQPDAADLQDIIASFRNHTAMNVFFQAAEQPVAFTPRELAMLSRILTEALNNADKYASAQTLRVLLTVGPSGSRQLLIEDDGVGFSTAVAGRASTIDSDHTVADEGSRPVSTAPSRGDHIGLALMQERAMSIGADLMIESEPGDGTRVTVSMPPYREARIGTSSASAGEAALQPAETGSVVDTDSTITDTANRAISNLTTDGSIPALHVATDSDQAETLPAKAGGK